MVAAGRKFQCTYLFRNIGSVPWTNPEFFLTSQSPRLNTTWGASTRPLPTNANVRSNQVASIPVTLKAPATPGTYTLRWSLYRMGAYDFGTPSTPIQVEVRHANASEFVSQDIPTAMVAGSTRTVSVTYRNVGAIAWKPGQFVLCAVNPFATNRWGIIAVPIASVTNPDGTVTFTFAIKAPSTPGTYNCQWQMRQSGEANFGPMTPNVAIVVN
jgi:hypothetical protein